MKVSDTGKNNENSPMILLTPMEEQTKTNKKKKISGKIEVLENEIFQNYPKILETLLHDQTTQKNIFWATDNYKQLGEAYQFSSQILPELITGEKNKIIMPRVKKEKELQQARVRDMAEVFTPSWICNAQNNLIDSAWFDRENVFNKEVSVTNGMRTWEVNKEKITFPKGKTWKDYVYDTRLEMACGEAPYITSRYDTTTGEFIETGNRIGLLDRKLRIINENVDNPLEWMDFAQSAYENTYAFEWQGDSLLLAREAMLISFIENYVYKFEKKPLIKLIEKIAKIISWNVWQMDGLKGVVPNSCGETKTKQLTLFGEEETVPCSGCKNDDLFQHNGIYCLIKDWSCKDTEPGKKGKTTRFIDLIK